ncbi:hypothetical protein K439DRAFT_1639198 [Ramaria rubella]|nr:hypothetical protein K439DRAFT_1639198 [Ramaria rubella]
MAIPMFLPTARLAPLVLLVCSSISIFFTFHLSHSFLHYPKYPISRFYQQRHTCSPQDYSAGNWSRKPHSLPLTSKDGVLTVSGFQGCASSREVDWHLGTSWDETGDDSAQKLHWRGNVSSYEWIPGQGCEDYAKVNPEELVQQLVEEGGWLVLGDSISEGHFFSLSCMLYPHVLATPDYTIDPWYFDRAWPQNLYLNPASPLLPNLEFPKGFEIDITPLITFRRVDLLLGKPELTSLHSSLYHTERPIFSDESTWDLDPNTYLSIFLAPLPEANYRTLVISTAGHWTTTLFSGFHNDEAEGSGLRDLLAFFYEAMNLWIGIIAKALEEANRVNERGINGKQRQVIVRAYAHGHESCHNSDVELAGPLDKYEAPVSNWYNWSWIRKFNSVFESLITQRAHPNIHFLPIDIPALLRPDGHTTGDCLHLLTGAGILEGWSEYISYFISRLP